MKKIYPLKAIKTLLLIALLGQPDKRKFSLNHLARNSEITVLDGETHVIRTMLFRYLPMIEHDVMTFIGFCSETYWEEISFFQHNHHCSILLMPANTSFVNYIQHKNSSFMNIRSFVVTWNTKVYPYRLIRIVGITHYYLMIFFTTW